MNACYFLLTANSVRVKEVVGAVDGLSAAGRQTLACPEKGIRTRLVKIFDHFN